MKLFLITGLFLLSTMTFSQFSKEKNYLGPCLGLSFLGSTPEIGANYEYSIDDNWGLGGIFRYFSYGEDIAPWGKYSYNYIFLGAQGSYHFKLDNPKFDPFVGLILGFDSYTNSWEYWEGYKNQYFHPGSSGSGGFYLSAHGTFRYWIKSNLGLGVRINFGNHGYGALDFGVDWKF